ncbi:MAG: insulinase family protein [Gemmatimonadota bacterium]|nr:insulinase family protein [Gemmatimonadota bacterium]
MLITRFSALPSPIPGAGFRKAVGSVPARVSGLAAAAMLMGANVAAAQAPAMDDPIPPDPAVVTGTLDNGLTFFIHENAEPENRAELRLVVNAGSILEDEDQLGLAHFVEHMAFNGTENFEKQELVDYLESIGMRFGPDINAYTSFDETVYMLQVPMDDPEVLSTAFQILVDWAGGVRFDPEEVDKERGVVIEEWRGRRGGQARIQDQQIPFMLHDSRYAERLPIGDPEILRTAPAERLRDFYEDWYRPDLMAVVAVGDFDPAEIEATIRERFGVLENPADPRPRTEAEVPVDHGPLISISADPEMPVNQVQVMYKRPTNPQGTVGDFRGARVRSLYTGMLNRRMNELTLQADPPFLFGGASLSGGISRNMNSAQLSASVPDNGAQRGIEAVLTEAQRVARHGFTAGELDRQKTALRRTYESRLAEAANRSSGSLASRYINVFLRGNPYPSVEAEMVLLDAVLPGITLEEVNAVGQEWMQEQGRVILVAGPEKEGNVAPTEEEMTAIFAAVAGKEIAPYEDADVEAPLVAEVPSGSPVVSEESVDEVGVTIWELENGVRVVLKPTDFKDDEVLFSATSPGGTSLATDENFVDAEVATQAVGLGGIGEFDQIELQKKLTGKRARVSPTIGQLTEGITGQASPQDLETAFQLIYLNFTAPRKDEDAFAAFKVQMSAVNLGAMPQFVLLDTVSNTMSQGHPRAGGTIEEQMKALQESDLDVALDFYRDRFADASDFTFFFVGAFDLEGIRPLVETWLGGLPNLGREETWVDLGIDPPAGVIEKVVHKGVEPQSQTQILFTGDGEYSLEEATTIRAMANILRIQLREVLREDLGGTYGVGVSGSLSYRPDEEYNISIQFGSDPERADELAAVVFEEIEKLKADGPDAETVAKVRETDRRSKETNLEQNGYWHSQLRTFEQAGRDFRNIPSYDLIESWTAEQVQQAAIRYLRLDQYAKFVLLPEKKIP